MNLEVCLTQLNNGVLDKNTASSQFINLLRCPLNKSIKGVEVIIIKHLEGVMYSVAVNKKRENHRFLNEGPWFAQPIMENTTSTLP